MGAQELREEEALYYIRLTVITTSISSRHRLREKRSAIDESDVQKLPTLLDHLPFAAMPPSTSSTAPVMKLLASVARKKMASEHSTGSAHRFIGTLAAS